MAGMKGRSGGARPGAGRPKRVPEAPTRIADGTTMLQMLQDVALGRTTATALQVRAAIAAVQYSHIKARDGGKKDAQADAAVKASTGRYRQSKAPLSIVKS